VDRNFEVKMRTRPEIDVLMQAGKPGTTAAAAKPVMPVEAGARRG